MTAAASTAEFMTLSETASLLALPESTFRRSYQSLFTDCRPVARRIRRVPRLFRRSEVELVVADGWEALAEWRAAGARRAKLAR
jgi:hypothetical protein